MSAKADIIAKQREGSLPDLFTGGQFLDALSEPLGAGPDFTFHTLGPVHLYQTELRPPAIGPLEVI